MPEYSREAAIEYAYKWAYDRNPDYLDYHGIGGDCTNFVSQCLYAGGCQMNFTPTYGWYYIDGNNKAPAWTGVEYLYNFLTTNDDVGPYAEEVPAESIIPGDVIQLSFDGNLFSHTLLVVATGRRPRPRNIRIATHSQDAFNRRLSSYTAARAIRYLHILGTR